MQIVGIVAIAENNAIGKNGKLPWHYSTDLKFFKATTTDNAIVMGRTTFESIGKPLPNRLNIVLSRETAIETKPNLLVVKSKEEVLAIAKYLDCNLFIIGGASIYGEFADVIEKWIVTEIPEMIEDADTFMTENFSDGFEVVEKINLEDELEVKIYERSEKC
jgi:dihydrofolate reductase